MKNEQGKTRKVNDPYEIWRTEEPQKTGGWEWRVLKKYQSPDNEAHNLYARWFTAVKSPMTHGSYEMGDTYVNDITNNAYKLTDEQMAEHLAKPENKWREF